MAISSVTVRRTHYLAAPSYGERSPLPPRVFQITTRDLSNTNIGLIILLCSLFGLSCTEERVGSEVAEVEWALGKLSSPGETTEDLCGTRGSVEGAVSS